MIYFTPELSQKTWRWFAAAPFEAGYRCRTRHSLEQTVSAWSPAQSPFEPLHPQSQDEEGSLPMPLPEDSTFADLIYYRDPADSEHYFYLPGNPSLAADAQGAPLLQLLIAGEMGLLQVNTQWQAAAETLDALRKKISAEQFRSAPALPRLSFAPVAVERVDLLLKTEDEEKLLASASSSGTPPFGALFSVRLNEAEQNHTIAALHQSEGLLRIRYCFTRFVIVEMAVQLEGNVATVWETLDASASLEECQAWVKQALSDGKLVLSRVGSALATEEFWQHTEDLAFNQAALWLKSNLQSNSPNQSRSRVEEEAMLAVSAKLTESRSIPLMRETDIATWFAGNKGGDHIRVVG